MEIPIYTPTGISHATSVDFSKRTINQPVHIVQYDRSLPILAVTLYNNGQLYPLPNDASISIRFGKPDKTFVYNKAIGCNHNRTTIYFEITQQMTLIPGEYYPVVEITEDTKIANSSSIYVIVDKNPIQHDYIESCVEYKELVEYRNEAKEAAEEAKNAAEQVSDLSEVCQNAATNAAQSEANALDSKNRAVEAETNAKKSEENAAQSEANALASKNRAVEAETNAEKSETNASRSEINAKESENLAKSYAIGTDDVTRPNDSEDNAKYYANISLTESAKCEQFKTDMETLSNAIVNKTRPVTFGVDFDTGCLMCDSVDDIYGFSVNSDTGNLEWEVNV